MNKSPFHQIAILFLLFGCAILFSCQENAVKGESRPTGEYTGIKRVFERGPVTVMVEVDQKEISIAERLNLVINVTADEDYEVELPGFGENLEQFGIVDYHTSQPRLVDKARRRISRSYVLEPFLSGEYTIPPMRVLFWEKGEKEKSLHEVETDALVIGVTSLLPEDKADLKLNDIKPPVQLPRSLSTGVWIGIVICVLCAGVIVCVVIWRMKKSGRDMLERGIPPHEAAFQELDALVAEDLIKKGDVKQFYRRVSNILRHYIERRFGLRAPEQTTVEFLTGLERDEQLPDQYNVLLGAFLTHCDLVKFAEHQPTTEDIQKTFDDCKGFVTDTTVLADG